MSKRLFSLTMSLIACSAMAWAQAQPHAQRPVRQIGAMQLLSRPDIQTDLQLTANQKNTLGLIRDKLIRMWTSTGKHAPTMATSRNDMQVQVAQADHQAEAALSIEQKQRLDEIRLQLRGIGVLIDPEMQKQLDFTDAQKAQVVAVQVRQQQQIKDHMRSGDFQRGQMMNVMKQVEAQMQAGLAKVLTPEQTEKLKQLKGKPFKETASS